ncbi:MAG TPA: sigma 54-interacting transcriptional regulator [Polyangiaceae bacterium]|nr:sigma 54-interacting transcriptional regulator [Polyangiaceae bacterium]
MAGDHPVALAAPVGYRLTVVEGPDAGLTFDLDGTEPARVLCGQSPACRLRLSDRQISRRHLALAIEGRSLRLTDLDSTNGTVIDGVRVLDAYLRGGELVRAGNSALRVDCLDSVAPARLSAATRFGKTLGASIEMRRLYPLCERLAASNVTVVIEGETGTGKEVLAESLHDSGPRANGPFVVFDCTAVPPNLVESALFGHEKGAFTGAIALHKGVFEQAHGGTLLIDEIGDLDPALQPKLLRVLERSEVRRVGGSRPIPVDVRVIAATRRDLDKEVQGGRFRDDLFFRLAVTRIELPALRDRHGDVRLLAEHFWNQLGGGPAPFPYQELRRFEDYRWPGNVRELHNAVAHLIALGTLHPHAGAVMDPASPPPKAPAGPTDLVDDVLAEGLPFPAARDKVLQDFERRYVQWVLDKHGGNVRAAAAASGIARRYFQLIRARTVKTDG